jgi:hypothetical protein
MRRTAVLRKWVESEGWGFANSYDDGKDGAPQRIYVHRSKLVEGSKELKSGALISFVVGPPRYPGECSAALEIEIVAQPQVKKETKPVLEVL